MFGKEKRCCAALILGGCVATVDAAVIHLTDSQGNNELNLYHGSSDTMQIRISTSSVDSINVCFVNAFLDSDGVVLTEVTDAVPGAPPTWTYDRSAFTFPAAISEAGGNEYGLVSGDQTGVGYPLGVAEYIHDSLLLTQVEDGAGNLLVTFELGSRQPQVFGPPPTYSPYTSAPNGFPPGFPNFLYFGDLSSNNPAFIVHQGIPEPATVLLLLAAIVGGARMSRN